MNAQGEEKNRVAVEELEDGEFICVSLCFKTRGWGSPCSGKQHRAVGREIWEETRQTWKGLWTGELLRNGKKFKIH